MDNENFQYFPLDFINLVKKHKGMSLSIRKKIRNILNAQTCHEEILKSYYNLIVKLHEADDEIILDLNILIYDFNMEDKKIFINLFEIMKGFPLIESLLNKEDLMYFLSLKKKYYTECYIELQTNDILDKIKQMKSLNNELSLIELIRMLNLRFLMKYNEELILSIRKDKSENLSNFTLEISINHNSLALIHTLNEFLQLTQQITFLLEKFHYALNKFNNNFIQNLAGSCQIDINCKSKLIAKQTMLSKNLISIDQRKYIDLTDYILHEIEQINKLNSQI